jgi:hypothetical protein
VTDQREHDETGSEGGFGGFLRSLLSAIPWSERAEGDATLHLDAPASASLRVDNVNGRTMIVGEERDDIVIEVHKTARAESEEAAERLVESMRVLHREDPAGVLEIEMEIPGRWNRKARADLTIHVPRGIRVQVTATNGRICLSGLRASVRLQSSNGPVRVSDVVGDVEIQTSNAKVHTECTCGSLTARSSNGKIELGEHRGSVDAATSNGTICCELAGLGEEGVTLVTSNGRISLDLPEDTDADVDIRVDNGLIRTVREFARTAGDRSGRVKGTLGRGGVPIRLRASNGTISLR